jgi:hypothetical protein
MAKRSENKRTFTKRMMKAILYVALIDLQLSYILAFLGKEQIAEQLSGDICHTIIGVCLGYFLKSYFETREEERNKRLDGGL